MTRFEFLVLVGGAMAASAAYYTNLWVVGVSAGVVMLCALSTPH